MSMYVSSVSLMDRGDGPAQAVIDRNARSHAQRIADDTKEELEKVLGRVENVSRISGQSEKGGVGSRGEACGPTFLKYLYYYAK